MDKLQKTQFSDNQNQDTQNNDAIRQAQQHTAAPQYYPVMHQHTQISNKGHPYPAPLLVNINNQQMMLQPAHRHFQQYPQQYAHQHNPQRVLNQQPQQTQIPVQCKEPSKQETTKDNQVKTQTPKHKTKEVEKKQLRSPSARRPPNAPVTMQGWLHKQGSEGLMLWKKRWFVLSEYCLFYYKGLQEEKVLGSILLPSYKVSMCTPDDKVNRKFAFKCEHANMRTYILAADSHELMVQWVQVLNLACNLQNNLENLQRSTSENNSFKTTSTPSGQTTTNHSFSNRVVHNHTSSNTTEFSNSSQQEMNQYHQPLYANAPPKPRRMADGYCSPGPEMLDRYSNYPSVKSPSNSYGRMIHPQEQLYNDNVFMGNQNTDRRTPDAYGRSNLSKYRNPSDYEDIYTEQCVYKRPLSPVVPDSISKKGYPTVNVGYPMTKGCAPPHMEMLRPHYPDPIPMRRPPVQTIARPHSADFLEYKPQKLDTTASVIPVVQQPRPKSSLDINMYTKECDLIPRSNSYFTDSKDNDYFYSEERYAEKMRKSAQYLQKMPVKYQPTDISHRKHRERQDIESYAYSQPFKEPVMQNFQPVRSRSALSESSLLENDSISREYFSGQDQHYVRTIVPDQFTRSASARLAQSSNFEESISRMEGERKREESMKRLLEWKQRMLQSPLNRKAHQAQAHRGYSACKENTYNVYPNYGADKKQKKSTIANRRSVHNLVQYNSYSSDDEASGSISINTKDATLGRDTFPRGSSIKRSVTPTMQPMMQARSATNLDHTGYNKNMPNYPSWMPHSQSHYLYEREQDFRTSQRDLIAKPKMNVSAGELLGRTHEELVLLLIQLRRQQAQTFQAIESCYNEIDNLQLQMRNMEQINRMENLQKLERIKQNLLELEKQYEKRKPLVNLVDNMVKLGTLYRNPNERSDIARHIRERLEFNQYVQERRLLAEEKREWNRTEPSHLELHEKVRQLYQLDGLIQEESRNLHNLQRDKEDIERALGGLRNRLTKGLNTPEEIEQARRQQFILENELSRVHLMLAQNSKKLEETVAGNARLEQELLILKQKLQNSRQHRISPQFSAAGDSLPYLSGSSSHILESDMERVQKKIGDLQKQREELSLQVRQLTDRSNTPNSLQTKNQSSAIDQSLNGNKKKLGTSSWRETDLDTMNSIDHGYDSYSSTSTTPLYINTDAKPLGMMSSEYQDRNFTASDSTSDDTALSSNQLEKPEIKTVRIVKRESERRQRDREKTFNGKCDPLIEEDDSSQGSSVLFRPQSLSYEHHSLPSRTTKHKSAELSPVFKSEAARQIITEVSKKSPSAQSQRRAIPREHRRHYTAPHDNSASLGSLEGRRARDDLDIERALRQRIDAPDLVRSTLSNKELKYNEQTIDNILSTPNKILIPERYIPEQMPQPSMEEQEMRKKKVESIKKMLSDTAIISAPATSVQDDKKGETGSKSVPTSSILEEKKQREHLLQLNQILAKQVMEMSKVVAGSTDPDHT